jgi:hypothetical protein
VRQKICQWRPIAWSECSTAERIPRKCNRMAPFRITYRDGRTQEVDADTYGRHGDRYIFTHDQNEILSLAADVVESIATADVPEAE